MTQTPDTDNKDKMRQAHAMGYEAGRSAGSWMFDGNTSDDTIRAFVKGLAEGDPEYVDQLPGEPLSGEWADGPTPQTLADDLDLVEDEDRLVGWVDEACDEYEAGFAMGVEDEVMRAARARLGNETVDAIINAIINS